MVNQILYLGEIRFCHYKSENDDSFIAFDGKDLKDKDSKAFLQEFCSNNDNLDRLIEFLSEKYSGSEKFWEVFFAELKKNRFKYIPPVLGVPDNSALYKAFEGLGEPGEKEFKLNQKDCLTWRPSWGKYTRIFSTIKFKLKGLPDASLGSFV